MTQKALKVQDQDVVRSTNEFLKQLLSSGKIQALLVPQSTPSKKVVYPVLIADPKKLHADVIAPVLPVATATMISKMTKIQPPSKPIGVVLRSCQIRALIELVKLNQANLTNIIIIGVDCPGTFPINIYADFPEKKTPTQVIVDMMTQKTTDAEQYLRSACQVCKDPIPMNADIVLGLYGTDIEKEIIIEAHTEIGKELLKDLNLENEKEGKTREKAVKDIREQKDKKRAAFLKQTEGINGIEKIAEFFDKCVNCHNCRQACPICYCKECLFDSAVFDAEAYKFIRKAENKGLVKMPSDALLFQLGRMNHMILSCVECGLCEQACPNTIPLMEVFIPAAENAQKEFTYHPGKDKTEKIPMIVYREDEFLEVGEK
ncbi:MAG: Coenzyme F420 hydrogenase/dehydrogenase, beta subunit C-terminal domain [Candidatus Thermoplasmatota archaeon]